MFRNFEPTHEFEEFVLANKIKGINQDPLNFEPTSHLSKTWVCVSMTNPELEQFFAGFKLRFRPNEDPALKVWESTDLHLSVKSSLDFSNIYMQGKGFFR